MTGELTLDFEENSLKDSFSHSTLTMDIDAKSVKVATLMEKLQPIQSKEQPQATSLLKMPNI
ncbi:MAG: hypothetical protein ACL7BU_10875 [Candidatus Phlomobacter fragariae]